MGPTSAPQLSYSPAYYPKASPLGQWSFSEPSWPTLGLTLFKFSCTHVQGEVEPNMRQMFASHSFLLMA